MLADLAPRSRFEMDIAERIIANSWRLRRVPGIEIRVNPLPYELEFPAEAAQDPHYADSLANPDPVEHHLANAWRNEPITRRYHCLHRHEAHLHRMITRDLRSLTQRQRERESDSSDLPIPDPALLSENLPSENSVISVPPCEHSSNPSDPVDPPDPVILSKNLPNPCPSASLFRKSEFDIRNSSAIPAALRENYSPTRPLIPHHLQSTGFALKF